jgi:alpha-beta hydrolase superfamily lysophospholipase
MLYALINGYENFKLSSMKELFTMAQVNQADDGNTESTLLEVIETKIASGDKVKIFVHAWVPRDAQRILLCVQALGGHGGYYENLAHQLACEGTIVVAPDLRGHGRSGGARGDVDRFERYLVDLDAAFTWASTMWPETPVFVMGESMGVSIATQFVASRRYPTSQNPLAGLVFVSPVLSSAIRPTLGEMIHFIRLLFIAPKRPSIAITGREEFGCRDSAFNELLRDDPLFVRLVSARFLIRLTLWFRQSERQAHKVSMPLLVLVGGRDYVARRSGTTAFLRHVSASDQHIVTFPQAYHSLFHDPDTPDVVRVLASWLGTHGEI